MTGTERKRAWRVRQKAAAATRAVLTPSRVADHSRVANHWAATPNRVDALVEMRQVIKHLRSEVRMAYAHAADHELNRIGGLLSRANAWVNYTVQMGRVPTYDALKQALNWTPELLK
jgi:hypothetical protein